MIVDLVIVQYLLIVVEVVDGGTTVVQRHILTVSTITNIYNMAQLSLACTTIYQEKIRPKNCT